MSTGSTGRKLSIAEQIAEFVGLDNIIAKREEGFYQFVKNEIKEIEKLKDIKEVLHELNPADGQFEGSQEDQENEADERLRGNLDLVEKLKKELEYLQLERLLDLSRSKILKTLGIESWKRLEEKATESGKPLHDYIFASLKENPENSRSPPAGAIEMLCTQSFINPQNIRDLEKAYISVYGEKK